MNRLYAFYAMTLLLVGLSTFAHWAELSSPAVTLPQEEGLLVPAPISNNVLSTDNVLGTKQPNTVTVNNTENIYCDGTLTLAPIVISEGANGAFSTGTFTLEFKGANNSANDYDFVENTGSGAGTGNVTSVEVDANEAEVIVTVNVTGTDSQDAITIIGLQIRPAAGVTNPRNVTIGLQNAALGLGVGVPFATINRGPNVTIDSFTDGAICSDAPFTFNLNLARATFDDIAATRIFRVVEGGADVELTAPDYAITFNRDGSDNTKASITATPQNAGAEWQEGWQLYVQVERAPSGSGCTNNTGAQPITLFSGSAQVSFTTAAAPQTSPLVSTGPLLLDISNTEPIGTFSVTDGANTLVAERDYEITPTGNAFARNGNNYVFTVADAGFFNIYTLRWGSNLNSLTNRVVCGSRLLIVQLFDGSPRQLVGITNSTVCRQLTGTVDVGWVGEGVTGDLISINSVNARPIGSAVPTVTNIITGNINSDYDGGIESGAGIVMGNINEDTDNFTVRIRYRVINDDGDITATIRNVYETIQVEDELDAELTLAGGVLPQARYCANAAPIDLVGAVDAGAVGVRAFTVTNLDPGGSPINFTADAPRRINFSNVENALTSDTEGITVGPNQNGYRIDFNFTSAANCESSDAATFTVAPLPPVIDIDPDTPDTDTIRVNYCVGVPLTLIDLDLPTLFEGEDEVDPATTRVIWLTDTEIPIDTVAFDAPYRPDEITNLRIGEYKYLV
ncbi:MAG: hypothetical protein AAF734_00480, partial [Bacteroidota bacterium]